MNARHKAPGRPVASVWMLGWTHLQHSGDVARPGAAVRQLDDTLARGVGQRTSVDEQTAELIDPAVTCNQQRS